MKRFATWLMLLLVAAQPLAAAEMRFKVDTALGEAPVNLFPLTDDTDFKTRETAVAYNAAGMDLVWNFVDTSGNYTQTAVTPTTGGTYDWTHAGDGIYTIEIPATSGASINNDTEGFGWFSGVATGVLPWKGPVIEFAPAMVVDAMTNGSDRLDVNVTHATDTAWNSGAIGASTLATDTITAAKIAADAIAASEIADNAIDAGALATDAITAAKIAADAIAASELATDAIGAAEIAADAIGASEIAAAAIAASEIASDAIGELEIANAAIDAATFAIDAINADAVADDTIDSATFADGAIAAIKIADDAITSDKIAANAIAASEVADNAIDAGALATDAVGAAELAADAIGAAEIATDAIGATELAAAAIGAPEIGANAIDANSIATDYWEQFFTLDTTFVYGDAVGGSIVAEIADNAGGSALTTDAIAEAMFTYDATATYGTANAGSVVKQIADNAGGSSLTEAGIADAVLDEALAGHTTSGTLGERIGRIPNAVAGASGGLFIAGSNAATTVNITGNITGNLSGSVGSVTAVGTGAIGAASFASAAITAGAIATDAIGAAEIAADAIDAAELASDVTTELQNGLATAAAVAIIDDFIDTEAAAIKAVTDKLDTALQLDGSVYRFTTNALELAPAGGGGGGGGMTVEEHDWLEMIAGKMPAADSVSPAGTTYAGPDELAEHFDDEMGELLTAINALDPSSDPRDLELPDVAIKLPRRSTGNAVVMDQVRILPGETIKYGFDCQDSYVLPGTAVLSTMADPTGISGDLTATKVGHGGRFANFDLAADSDAEPGTVQYVTVAVTNNMGGTFTLIAEVEVLDPNPE